MAETCMAHHRIADYKANRYRYKSSRRQDCYNNPVRLLIHSDSSNATTIIYKSKEMISLKSKENNKSMPNLLITMAAMTTMALSFQVCQCDNISQKSPSNQFTAQSLSAKKLQSSPSASSQREHLLASLSDNIERQHLRVKPIRSFVQARPSKFDSVSSDLQTDSSDVNYLTSHHNRYNQHTSASASSFARPSPGANKADEGMRHIMRMHEHALSARLHQQPTTASPNKDNGSANRGSSRWKDIARDPSQFFSQLVQSNKVVSHLMSYLPTKHGLLGQNMSLFGTKLLPHSFSGRALSDQDLGLLNLNSGQSVLNSLPKSLALSRPAIDSNEFYTATQPKAIYDFSNDHGHSKTDSEAYLPPANKALDTSIQNGGEGMESKIGAKKSSTSSQSSSRFSNWPRRALNRTAQFYIQDSLRDLLALSQLPILAPGPISTAPSVFERGGKQYTGTRFNTSHFSIDQTQLLNEILRYAYLFRGVRRKRDPLKALSSNPTRALILSNPGSRLQETLNKKTEHFIGGRRRLSSLLPMRTAKPRGVMWDMATDPSLAVTVFHLLERASVALPLGFLLMPFVQMIRNPLNGINPLNLGRILPARASHRSVDYEELVKRLDLMDKMLSKALRPTHREESFIGK